MATPITFGLQSYQLDSKPVSVQRCVNWYAEIQQEGKSKTVLYPTPGLLKKLTLGTTPVYGLHVVDGTLYAVTATKLYSISSAWSATELASVTIAGPCSMANNGTSLVFVDGTNGYSYNTSTATLTTLTTASNWYPANRVDFQDQYLIFNRSGTGQFFISNLSDPTTYSALDFATAEGAPDDTIGIIVDHRELWLFGEKSIEIWQNTGGAAFPFERVAGAFIERGCAASLSLAKNDNTVFWLGDDRIVYRANGYTPQRISTHAIETAIDGYSTVSDAVAWFQDTKGHKFYWLTFPTANKTWVYDVASGLWHERSYRDTVTGGEKRHRAGCYAKAYNTHVVGDYSTGEIYALDHDTYTDDGDTIRRLCSSPYVHSGREWVYQSSLEIEFEAGVGTTSGQGSDPQVMLRYSDDGGRTYSNEKWRSIGAKGAYENRAFWKRLGRFRTRTFEVTITDPVNAVILGAYAELASGR